MYRVNAYSLKGAAAILGISVDEVLELIESEELESIWVPRTTGRGEAQAIPDYELERYLERTGDHRHSPCPKRPRRIKFEVSMDLDDFYDEGYAHIMDTMSKRYRQDRVDDLY